MRLDSRQSTVGRSRPMTTLRSPASPDASDRVRPVRVALVNDFELVLRGIEGMLAPYKQTVSSRARRARESTSRIDVAVRHHGQPQAGTSGCGRSWPIRASEQWRSTPGAWRPHRSRRWSRPARRCSTRRRARRTLGACRTDRRGETVVSPEFCNPAARIGPVRPSVDGARSEVASLLLQGLSNRRSPSR